MPMAGFQRKKPTVRIPIMRPLKFFFRHSLLGIPFLSLSYPVFISFGGKIQMDKRWQSY